MRFVKLSRLTMCPSNSAVEGRSYKAEVVGSIPTSDTNFGSDGKS